MRVHPSRVKLIAGPSAPSRAGKCVVYWMSRDQRADDNWALLHAFELAAKHSPQLAVRVVFNLVPSFGVAARRQYGFMMRGLEETEQDLRRHGIPLHVTLGPPPGPLVDWFAQCQPAAVVCDMDPLRTKRGWVADVAKCMQKKLVDVPLLQVDAHNVIPVWIASDKQEVAARTMRPRINRLLSEYLVPFPALPSQELPPHSPQVPAYPWTAELPSLESPAQSTKTKKGGDSAPLVPAGLADATVPEVSWLRAGPAAGRSRLEAFCASIKRYEDRNDPTSSTLSNLSPYFNFGQLAPQRAILSAVEAKKRNSSCAAGADAFIEEALVRRELSDNFCWYNAQYDSIAGAAAWARETLRVHSRDAREYVYSSEEWECARTHDTLWNAAQVQLVVTGKIHGYMRMYWAKKLLEWSSTPEEALRIGVYLNDKYALDGHAPNGYVGLMWSMCGVHDMGWTERAIFGKIRYMNWSGCKRKFSVDKYISAWPQSLIGKPGADAAMLSSSSASVAVAKEGGVGVTGDDAVVRPTKKTRTKSSSSATKPKK